MMRTRFSLAAASAFALALAACGSDAEETVDEIDVAADEEAAADTAVPGASETPAPDASATPGAEPTPGETPSPTPSASATTAAVRTPSATPTQVAAAGPPAAFTTCAVCHSVSPGQNGIGPTLAGVVGRAAGSVPGANYSAAMQAANLRWTEANLQRFLTDPNAVVSGTSMPAPGLDAAERRAVIDYLKTL